MSELRRYTRKNLPVELASCSRWKKADISNLSDEEATRFRRLQEALTKYLSWQSLIDVLKGFKLTYEQVIRALNRCVAMCDDGHPFGWRGLIAFARTKDYERRKPVTLQEAITRGGYAGALKAFFRDHSDIQEKLDRYLHTRRRERSLPESRVGVHAAHGYFLDLCKAAKISPTQWPYCVDRLGRGAISRYTRQFFDRNYDDVVLHLYGDRARAKSKTGTGIKSRLTALRPYDIVELDEHRAHFIGSIGIPTEKGLRWLPIRRVTLILLVDRFSGVVLGYYPIFRREARTSDVLNALASAMRPWKLRKFSLPGLNYPKGAGFPSAIPGLGRCGWGALLVDNALAHLAYDIVGRVRAFVGCAVNFGAVRRFERRPIAERVFGELSNAGFHRVPSTTGSHARDPLRQEAESKAAKHRMSMEAILDLIELVISDYNAKCGKANFGIGGLDFLREAMADEALGFLPPDLPPACDAEPDLDVVIESRTVGGIRASGHRPHIYLDEVEYTNEDLARRWDLIDRPVRMHIREENILTFEAYLDDGTALGTVKAQGRWAQTPHSREARRQINALLKSGELRLARGECPVIAWLKLLGERGLDRNRANKPKTTNEASQIAEELRHGNVAMPMVGEGTDSPALETPRASEVAKAGALPELATITALN